MKNVFLLILIAIFQLSIVNSQTPQAFKYQAVARDANGKELANQQLNLRIGISKSNTGSLAVYRECFVVTTNALGLFNIEIGNGTLISGSFIDINWAEGPYYVSTELSTDSGSTYPLKGVAQLFSVPYARYADKSGQGERGPTGPQGLIGEKGDKGDTGPAGKDGTKGDTGLQGPKGEKGDQGDVGHKGATGPKGDTGQQGVTGPKGDTGAASTVPGPQGVTGPKGDTGQKGDTGADSTVPGPQGITGPKGDTGAASTVPGPQGETGPKGDTGPAYYTAGTGIAINGTEISNIKPDQTVTLTGSGITTTGGTYPDLTVNTPAYTAGTGIAVAGTVITNTTPDKTVKLTGSSNVTVSGTYPEFAIKGTPSLTQAQIDALTPYKGMVVYNETTNCVNYYNGSSWFESCGVCTPQPTKADAGADQLILIGTSSTLAANTPLKGKGNWSIISGEGGKINNTASPTSTFTGKAETKYSLRWAITTSCGVSADTVVIWFWSCGIEITDSRDGKNYQTVKIGSQCWMKQNLNIGTRIYGDINQENNSTIEKYCYKNDESYCNIYGGLYQWDEMMQYVTTEGVRGICPKGWHIPSDAEWKQLEMYLGMSQSDANAEGWRGTDEGGKLKETGTAHWVSPNTGATNSSGFTALPGGYSDIDGSFYYVGINAFLWTSSPDGSGSARYRILYYDYSRVGRDAISRLGGFSVRCVKD